MIMGNRFEYSEKAGLGVFRVCQGFHVLSGLMFRFGANAAGRDRAGSLTHLPFNLL
jgi:hypothetical protein